MLHPLDENSDLKYKVLPVIWAAYKIPFSQVKPIEEMPVQDVSRFIYQLSGGRLSKEQADQISLDFHHLSLHDFCVRHLDKKLDDISHEHILLTAQDLILKDSQAAARTANPLSTILGLNLACTTHAYSNRLFRTACYLKERGVLPKELDIMFIHKISPVGYRDRNWFSKCEELLKPVMEKHSEDEVWPSFDRWRISTQKQGSDPYLPYLVKTIRLIESLQGTENVIFRGCVENYLGIQRASHHQPRGRVSGRSARGERN